MSEKEIHQSAAKVMHSEIGRSVNELEMTKERFACDNMVELTMAFPFLVVPMRDCLVHSVQEMKKKLDGDIQLKIKGKSR